MEEKKFLKIPDKKFAKQGPDYILIVPRKLIKYGVIDITKRYNIYIEEVKEE